MIYLIHLEGRMSPNHATQHYLGYTADLVQRIGRYQAALFGLPCVLVVYDVKAELGGDIGGLLDTAPLEVP